MANRRDTWRQFMSCFEPAGDPREAVARNFYVPRPGRTIAEQLASRLEIKPATSHLLVGGIGSGKTTQLLVAQKRLASLGDVDAIYIDVSAHVDLGDLSATTVNGLIAVELSKCLGELEDQVDLNSLRSTWQWWLDPDGWQNEAPGFLDSIEWIQQVLQRRRPHQIVLLDSLDRMSDLDRFVQLIEGAFMPLHRRGIGLVVVGPLTALYGIRRAMLDRFDRSWHQPAIDVTQDAEGRAFLLAVLSARDPGHLITPEAAERLAIYCGGVLRDLIALTQLSAEEAYVEGKDRILAEHVAIAAEQFGRKHLFAIDSQQLAVLERVRTAGTFVQTSEKDLALLATRRVLEYGNGKPRFAVHPTIAPLLAQLYPQAAPGPSNDDDIPF